MKIREGLDKLDATADLIARGEYAGVPVTFAQPVELHPEPAPELILRPATPDMGPVYAALIEKLKEVKLYG